MLGQHKLAIVFGMKFSELKEVFASSYKQTQTEKKIMYYSKAKALVKHINFHLRI